MIHTDQMFYEVLFKTFMSSTLCGLVVFMPKETVGTKGKGKGRFYLQIL